MSKNPTSIDFFSMRTVPMRAFHLAWMAFFSCFYAWFTSAPLMPVIQGEFAPSVDQLANINIAAFVVTVLVVALFGSIFRSACRSIMRPAWARTILFRASGDRGRSRSDSVSMQSPQPS